MLNKQSYCCTSSINLALPSFLRFSAIFGRTESSERLLVSLRPLAAMVIMCIMGYFDRCRSFTIAENVSIKIFRIATDLCGSLAIAGIGLLSIQTIACDRIVYDRCKCENLFPNDRLRSLLKPSDPQRSTAIVNDYMETRLKTTFTRCRHNMKTKQNVTARQ